VVVLCVVLIWFAAHCELDFTEQGQPDQSESEKRGQRCKDEKRRANVQLEIKMGAVFQLSFSYTLWINLIIEII
jgi:hypothetical protein